MYSGLNTQIGLLASPAVWRVAVILVAVAIVGKGVACLLAARVAGEAWRESVAIGVLMNARGLMELMILNIGLQHGIITPTLFTIMVLMAVVTTLMTSPLFDLVYGRRGAMAAQQEQTGVSPRRRRFLAALVLVVVALAAAACAPMGMAAHHGRTSTVDGGRNVGTVSAAPDMAEITTGVVTQAPTAAQALAANSQAMERLLQRPRHSGRRRARHPDHEHQRVAAPPRGPRRPAARDHRLRGDATRCG